MEIVSVRTEGKAYSISIESGLFHKLPQLFKERYHGRKLAIISDSHVYPIYGEALIKKLRTVGLEVVPIVFEAGEERKNLETLTTIFSSLAEGAFTRSDFIVALGGGVTGDMAGLAAATFLRGMGFIQVPTSLLAMVDSSIGGKVAVDLPQGKNLVGAFYQPDAVYTDSALLDSLSDRQFSNGMAELLKHGMICDKALLDTLVSIKEPSGNQNESFPIRKALVGTLDRAIMRSCEIKRDVVERDEQDNGIRQLLNFGHTFGHALERVQHFSGLTHGEAISVGMVVMTRLTEEMGLTKKGTVEKLIEIFELYRLPTQVPDLCIDELINALRLDKKTRSGKITIAYIEEIGQGKLFTLDLTELEDRLYGILTHTFPTP